MATIADVAKLAGVSMMTVSRVINKNRHVSEKTRQRVMEAIEELSFRPNMVARGLATRHNHMIAYVMSDLANPFFAKVNMGIDSVCVGKGYTVIVYDVQNAGRMKNCIDMLIDRRIDGVIFHHLNITSEQVALLHANGVRCVTIDNEYALDEVTTVDCDDYLGARMATRHLIEAGHTRIGCVHSCLDDSVIEKYDSIEYIETFQRKIWRERMRGFKDEMAASGLTPSCFAEGRGTAGLHFLGENENLSSILTSKERPSAIYCQNDIFALMVLSECLEYGVSVPDQLALVGHDGLDFATNLYPRLTTICQPRYDIGVISAQKLIDEIENNKPIEHIVTTPILSLGNTT